jgi:hypothetical protein
LASWTTTRIGVRNCYSENVCIISLKCLGLCPFLHGFECESPQHFSLIRWSWHCSIWVRPDDNWCPGNGEETCSASWSTVILWDDHWIFREFMGLLDSFCHEVRSGTDDPEKEHPCTDADSQSKILIEKQCEWRLRMNAVSYILRVNV